MDRPLWSAASPVCARMVYRLNIHTYGLSSSLATALRDSTLANMLTLDAFDARVHLNTTVAGAYL